MRRLRRPGITPPTLAEGGKGHRVAASASGSFPGHWTEPDVRGALLAMHGWVCAYCQRPTDDDVDHFRPKSLYPWLAYSFSNYFLSCETCNRRCKKNKFPLAASAARATSASRVDREARLLLDPTRDPVEEWMRTELAEGRYRIESLVDRKTQATAAVQVDETIRLFKLNRRADLRQERKDVAKYAVLVLDGYRDEPPLVEDLRRMASRFAPHGITVRAVLKDFAEELLPSPEEELSWLVDGFVELLKTYDEELERERILWALAVLWKDPPAGTTAQVEAWLVAKDVVDEIRPYRRRL